MKHLCPRCGAFIKWALLFCFACNERLAASGGVVSVGGERIFPPYKSNN